MSKSPTIVAFDVFGTVLDWRCSIRREVESLIKQRFILCTLSNSNLGLLANMAKHAGLHWDLILSAEVFRCHTAMCRALPRLRATSTTWPTVYRLHPFEP